MLDRKKRYLQIALNSTLEEAKKIIFQLPANDRILIEAGTPLIKRYGARGIAQIKTWYEQRLLGIAKPELAVIESPALINLLLFKGLKAKQRRMKKERKDIFEPYVVADLKCMDRGITEVEIASRAGANAAVALGSAPIETIDAFVQKCEELGLDAMIDMMNIDFPLKILRELKQPPAVVILHRGVDEESFNKEKEIPFYEISRIKNEYDIMISIAGGDTFQEVQRAAFNDADIVVVWKSFYKSTEQTAKLAEEFLKEIR